VTSIPRSLWHLAPLSGADWGWGKVPGAHDEVSTADRIPQTCAQVWGIVRW